MLFNLCLALLAAVPLSAAAPTSQHTDPATLEFLKIGAVLENLDAAFYKATLAKFQPTDYTGAGFTNADIPIKELTGVESDEVAHAKVLEELLTKYGGTPLSCQYDVSALITDVPTAVHVARVIEFVGSAAFGGAAPLIGNKDVITTAVSIAQNEAQHEMLGSLLNVAKAIPNAFVPAILAKEALAIAGKHISGCDLDVTPNPSLSLLNSGPISPGTKLQFSSPAITGGTSYYCQLLVGGAATAIVLPLDNCIVPAKFDGGVFAFVTKTETPLSGIPADRKTVPGIIGPTVFFIETLDLIGQLIRTLH